MRNELVIGGYSIDTIEDIDINITKEVYNIDDPSKRQSDFSKSVDIPGSKLNDFVFKSLFDVSFSIRNSDQLNPDFNPSKKASCVYYQDTLQQISGYCQLNEIKVLNNDQVTYSITIYGKNIDIFSRLTDKTLNDLTTLGTATWNDTEIVNSWTATFDPTIKLTYPLLDVGLDKFGFNGDASTLISHNYNSFKPFIYVGHIINAIFEEAEVPLEVASFFNTAQFQKLIIQCDITKFQQNQTLVDTTLVTASRNATQTITPVATSSSNDLSAIWAKQIQWNIETTDPANQFDTTTGTFTMVENAITNFEVNFTGNITKVNATAGTQQFLIIRRRGADYKLIGAKSTVVSGSGAQTCNFTIPVDSKILLTGDEVRVCMGGFMVGGTFDNTQVTNYIINSSGNSFKQFQDGQINYGQTFNIYDILPRM
jgi:hypothetical protein